jgi:ketose-bisphosphate aldolase
VAAHLDHASDPDFIGRALDAGCRSVMYDGSALPLEENRENAARVVARAAATGASVEAEIGIIGGKEEEVDAGAVSFPTPAQAREFAASTGIDLLAPAIGTVHGPYPGSPRIRWDLARELAQASPVPVVLHGATGLDDDTLRRLADLGYAKVNFATGVRAAFVEGIRQHLEAGDSPRPQEVLRTGRRAVGDFVAGILEVLRR